MNASVVTDKERNESEKIYVRRVQREVAVAESACNNGDPSENKKESDSNDNESELFAQKQRVLSRHPSFERLAEKHASSMLPIGAGGSSMSMGNHTINVTIHSMAAASCTSEPMSKRLPSSLNIGRLKQMCKRAFKLDTDLQVLHFKADKNSLLSSLGDSSDDDDNTLAYFGVPDGAQIFMNEVDIKAKKAEAAAEAKRKRDAEERMEQQEEDSRFLASIEKMKVDEERLGVAAVTGKG